MTKAENLSNPASCLNRAADDELIFVLLEHDAAAPRAIRAWVTERIRLGMNRMSDEQIIRAIELAEKMETSERRLHA